MYQSITRHNPIQDPTRPAVSRSTYIPINDGTLQLLLKAHSAIGAVMDIQAEHEIVSGVERP